MQMVQLANFYSATSGGLRVAVDHLRAGYRAVGHECALVMPGAADVVKNGVWTLRSPALPKAGGYRVILRRRAVLRMLDQLRPDLLEVHDRLLQHWVWPWSRSRGVPLVAMSHERLESSLPLLLPLAPTRLLRAATAAIARRAVAECDALVVCSRFAAVQFPGPTRLVRLGVDLDAVPHDLRGAGGRPMRLIAVSRLSPEKRPDLPVETLRVLVGRGVDASLLVLGDGPLRTAVERRAAGLPVTFGGFLPNRASVTAALKAADIALVPGPVETFGLAALEALACGVPIVATAGAAPADLVVTAPAAGRVAQPAPGPFADAVLDLLRMPVGTRRSAARAVAERYPWAATVSGMLAVHESARHAVAGGGSSYDPGVQTRPAAR